MPIVDWTPQQRALMKWLCLPGDSLMGKGRGLQQPTSLTKLAEQLNVSRQTLYDWQQIPGWDEALGVMAEQTFKSMKPRFLTNLAASLLKPDPNDRLVTAWVRYVEPTIEDHEEQGHWSRILPDTTRAGSQEVTEQVAQDELRQLPTSEREIILNFMDRVRNRENTGLVTERKNFQVMRMTTQSEDMLEAEQLVKEQEGNVVELRVLPGSGLQTPTYTSDQCKTDTYSPVSGDTTPTPAYNSRLRKPLRKPKH
jgi:hypothetical protein